VRRLRVIGNVLVGIYALRASCVNSFGREFPASDEQPWRLPLDKRSSPEFTKVEESEINNALSVVPRGKV
jgi:hypothetical protein